MNKHIVQLIRERFYPLVRFCGPQSAGEVEIEGVRETLYLGELSVWLWPVKSSHNGILSDEQLGDVVSPNKATFALTRAHPPFVIRIIFSRTKTSTGFNFAERSSDFRGRLFPPPMLHDCAGRDNRYS
jgi:hypothetical protein